MNEFVKTLYSIFVVPWLFLWGLVGWGFRHFWGMVAWIVYLGTIYYEPKPADAWGIAMFRLIAGLGVLATLANLLEELPQIVRNAVRPLRDWDYLRPSLFYAAGLAYLVGGIDLLMSGVSWPARGVINFGELLRPLLFYQLPTRAPAIPVEVPFPPVQVVAGLMLLVGTVFFLEGVRRTLIFAGVQVRLPKFKLPKRRKPSRVVVPPIDPNDLPKGSPRPPGVRVVKPKKPIEERFAPNARPKGVGEKPWQPEPPKPPPPPKRDSEEKEEFRFVREDVPPEEPEPEPAPKRPEKKRLTRDEVLARLREQLILPPETERKIVELAVLISDPEGFAEKWGVEPPKGAVLWGPPGTGKTSIARFLAEVTGMHFMAVSPAEARSKWVGESAKLVSKIYRDARASAPTLLFLDEADTIAGRRDALSGAGGDQEVAGAVNQLLQEIEGVRPGRRFVFTLAATNHPDNLDPAFRSRLARDVPVGLPDKEGRRKILELALKPLRKSKRLAPDVNLTELAERTEGFSGRGLKRLVNEAITKAHTEGREVLEMEDFLEALDFVYREGDN